MKSFFKSKEETKAFSDKQKRNSSPTLSPLQEMLKDVLQREEKLYRQKSGSI